jgi:hypothetical protein
MKIISAAFIDLYFPCVIPRICIRENLFEFMNMDIAGIFNE